MALGLYLDALFGAEPAGGLVEVRYRRGDGRPGMGQTFHAWPQERGGAAEMIGRLGRSVDTYIGVAPRRRRHGGREAIERVHVLYVDCDSEAAIEGLERFSPPPAIVVGSGSGRHAYWPLWPPASPDEAERANRRLAHHLGADMVATDASRILRPPGTLNFKTDPPRPVEVERLVIKVYTVEEVAGHLRDPEPSRPAPRRLTPPSAPGRDPLLAIAPPIFVELLTGRQVGRDGKAICPFHAAGAERSPSLHAYATPEEGWTCFAGCGGGTIIDLGALLYGIEPRGAGYHEVRRRLAAALLGQEAAA
ncbi:MAG: DNA-primase RepB domain-containing protein [Thermoleophilaceae bacterium]